MSPMMALAKVDGVARRLVGIGIGSDVGDLMEATDVIEDPVCSIFSSAGLVLLGLPMYVLLVPISVRVLLSFFKAASPEEGCPGGFVSFRGAESLSWRLIGVAPFSLEFTARDEVSFISDRKSVV